jgi:ArsR family metal-binding transcriptional regulator
MKFKVVRVCESRALSSIPQVPVRYDLHRAAELLSQEGFEVSDQEVMLVSKRARIEITLYTNGRLMMEPVEAKEQAQQIANDFYSVIEGAREST